MTDLSPASKAHIIDSLRTLAVPVVNLLPDPENARRGDVPAVQRSLNVFGQRKPIVVKQTGTDADGRPTGIIMAGNHTFAAALELGWTEIAAVFVDDDAATAKAYALADNRTGELATWDQEQLYASLRELSADAFDMDALGWSETDLATILSAPDPASPPEQEAVRPPEVVTPPAGDVRALALENDAVDAVVCDPPYELGFMGKHWDASGVAYDIETWRSCYRVLKPGGYLLAFGGTRTFHRMAVAIEDAGFEIRDSISWLYGSGFPKSLDVSKAIDKAAGHWRGKAGDVESANGSMSGPNYVRSEKGDPVTAAAAAWNGWGTALKPAHEPIVVARKPFDGTVAENVLAHGTGALNVDGCRVGSTVETWPASRSYAPGQIQPGGKGKTQATGDVPPGRWPSNVVLSHLSTPDGGDACADGCVDGCPVAELDAQSGVSDSRRALMRLGKTDTVAYGDYGEGESVRGYDDSGGASRFFPTFRYTAKAPTSERPNIDGVQHPTVKPVELMRWLVRLVTPYGGTVLDPFAGSGTTIEAALLEGFAAVAVERHAPYHALIQERIDRTGAAADRYRILRDDEPFTSEQ
jgi:hypothetical protein